MAKISLIIPIYNAEKYLAECLASVKAQSFGDFECLCVNDGSTDASAQIIEKLAQKDPRFCLINQKNCGCSMARNKGIEVAQGEYLAFLDQDDLLHPQALETLFYLIEKYKSDVAAFEYQNVAENFKLERVEPVDLNALQERVIENLWDDFFDKRKGASIVIWTKLYKKEAVKDLWFPQNVQPAEDTIYTLQVIHKAKKMVKTDKPLLFYRDSATSVMNRGITNKYVQSHLRACETIYDYFFVRDILTSKQAEQLHYYLARMFYKTTISQVLRKSDLDRAAKDRVVAQLQEFKRRKIFNPQFLELRKRIAIKLFFNKLYRLAKALV